mmetsp:Transcript_39631/g.77985  ORF Transcript_39631/g.77985 Transcript_39631/m.77985 type:complete len:306 (+) Transcript_39631:277-1194(+)
METCVQNKIALSSDLTPSEALLRLSETESRAVPLVQKDANRESMVPADLRSYDMFGGVQFNACCENKEKVCESCLAQRYQAFKNACLYRSRFTGNKRDKSSLLFVSPHQERSFFDANARDLSIGAFLDIALDVNLGKGLASRKLNLLGEIDGVAGIVNSEEGLRRRRQAAALATSLESMKVSQRREKIKRKQAREAKTAKKKQKLDMEAPVEALLTKAGVLPWVVPGQLPSNQITIPPLKAFLDQHGIQRLVPSSGDCARYSRKILMAFLVHLFPSWLKIPLVLDIVLGFGLIREILEVRLVFVF